jgi:hypothetical protein
MTPRDSSGRFSPANKGDRLGPEHGSFIQGVLTGRRPHPAVTAQQPAPSPSIPANALPDSGYTREQTAVDKYVNAENARARFLSALERSPD